MTFTPTPEQHAIFSEMSAPSTSPHLIIDAKAGAGKTSTLIAGLGKLSGNSLVMAFNKSIAVDIKTKVDADTSLSFIQKAQINVSTVHAHGMAAFNRARSGGGRAQVQGGKLSFLLRDLQQPLDASDPARRNTRHIAKLASFAKQSGFGLTSVAEEFPGLADKKAYRSLVEHYDLDLELESGYTVEALIDDAIDLLMLSNRKLGMIDFDDMIYLPLLLNYQLTLYSNVLIDEAQDINATRRELAFRSLKPDGRLIAVGDPHQAIYGFTGASTDSLNDIAKRCSPPPTWLPLSICWRCDDAVLDEARAIVPTIKTAEHKLGKGKVTRYPFRQEPLEASFHKEYPAPGYDFLALPRPGDAILCRLNRPNVATALGLLRRGTPAKIEGRDLGGKLLSHVKRATDLYAHQPLSDTLLDLESYKQQESAKLAARDREAAAALLEDEVDAAILLCERAIEQRSSAAFVDLEALVQSLFGDDVNSKSCVTLSSVHKAKGREWPRVFILGRGDYMPFWKASEGWQMDQEMNLIYVAITRAESELVYVTGVQSAIDKGLHREPPLKQGAK